MDFLKHFSAEYPSSIYLNGNRIIRSSGWVDGAHSMKKQKRLRKRHRGPLLTGLVVFVNYCMSYISMEISDESVPLLIIVAR